MPQLANLIRQKYPGEYDDMSDDELERKILEKYPEYADLAEKSSTKPKSTISKFWSAVSEPLTEAPSRMARSEAERILTEPKEYGPIESRLRGFGAGALEGLGDVISGLTSPLNIGMTAAGIGAAKGIPGSITTLRALSAPVIAHGGMQVFNPESSLSERAFGVAEMAGGLAGLKGKLPEVAGRVIGEVPPPAEVPKLQVQTKPTSVSIKKPTPALVERMKQEGYVPAGVDSNGYPRMILKNEPKSVAMETASPESIKTPFHEEITIQNPGATAIQRLKKKGYDLQTVDETGKATFKFTQPSAETTTPAEKTSVMRELWNFPRGAITTNDLSAPMRQGFKAISYKEWWTSWDDMMRAWGSEKAYQNIIDEIHSKPIFQKRVDTNTGKLLPSFAEESGLKLTELKTLSNREENLMSTWAEKIPGARKSNRAYTAFLDKLRADLFERLINESKNVGRNPFTDTTLSKEIAEFVNTATGRGRLSTQLPTIGKGTRATVFGKEVTLPFKERSLEQHAELLTNALFAPRIVASNLRMLNPATYIMVDPFVRKQYLRSLISSAGLWMTIAGVSKFAGADVSLDTNSADFGKIKIGNTRIDPAAGFQQYIVAASKLISGKTVSTTTGREFELGQGYRATTRKDILEQFGANKLHPILKFAYDLVTASKYKPFHVGDRIVQMFVPLIVGDAMDLAKEDPSLLPWLIPVATGMGTQTYEKGKPESVYVPEESDVTLQGGSF